MIILYLTKELLCAENNVFSIPEETNKKILQRVRFLIVDDHCYTPRLGGEIERTQVFVIHWRRTAAKQCAALLLNNRSSIVEKFYVHQSIRYKRWEAASGRMVGAMMETLAALLLLPGVNLAFTRSCKMKVSRVITITTSCFFPSNITNKRWEAAGGFIPSVAHKEKASSLPAGLPPFLLNPGHHAGINTTDETPANITDLLFLIVREIGVDKRWGAVGTGFPMLAAFPPFLSGTGSKKQQTQVIRHVKYTRWECAVSGFKRELIPFIIKGPMGTMMELLTAPPHSLQYANPENH